MPPNTTVLHMFVRRHDEVDVLQRVFARLCAEEPELVADTLVVITLAPQRWLYSNT